tara:strand:- start:3865 stop:4947 length:1083 start_codon:yes stop_codon:yes gene_type:complete
MQNGNGYGSLEDARISGYRRLETPRNLKLALPVTAEYIETVQTSRQNIRDILNGRGRKLIVIGPCSVHDAEAAKDYAERLRGLRDEVGDSFEVVMRNYFEKPRTVVGWKGLIYDPHLDGGENINEGLHLAREILIHNVGLGLPTGTEFLDTIVPQYIDDLTSWVAIGARTVESQIHRQLASGLSMPVGFKNTTGGDIGKAVNAVAAAREEHYFISVDQDCVPCAVGTRGNKYGHIILRGSDTGTNYDSGNVVAAQELLKRDDLEDRVMVDTSHGNSKRDHRNQPEVFVDVVRQMVDGNTGVIGWMVESNLNEGAQKARPGDTDFDRSQLEYGVSVTDACISWDDTVHLLRDAHRSLKRAA